PYTTLFRSDVERGKSVERAAQDQAAGGQGRLERIADEVVQVVTAEALYGFDEERMQDDRRREIRGRLPEWIERAVAERPAHRVGVDHRAAQPQRSDSEAQLLHGVRG